MEARDLPEEIKKAVNAALDDLEDKIRQSTGDLLCELGADLERVTENFERAIDQIHRYRPSPKPAAVLAPVPVRGSGS
ncbi:hypothetical protein LI90_3953 [Carbonactinospora thermoautotrophica]|uniref:Uncharacterized protein n=1 Tax=Carbonactinospora thermoautotrophica TaxID=1469144 RepID=A0A132MYJ9_9ACTN|nr:hypothetical protein [Carbonactinospora thermoautotrophica]KWX02904.1 hypothetical protein LI90_3953 [Carbonactinospora thermoautotrophica]